MTLNYHIEGEGQPIILLHGLFGNLTNLGVLARAFMADYQVIQVDLRNHGLSFWSQEMNYSLMANDIIELINQLALNEVIIIGHSMGGKVAMCLTALIPNLLKHVIVLDIAPVIYHNESIQKVINAIEQCHQYQLQQSTPIDIRMMQQIMSHYLDKATMQFLLKSYKDDHWLFNFSAIANHLTDICGWEEMPAYVQPILFIRGGRSNYIIDEYQGDILNQFPYAVIETIQEAGHNVHAEKPQQVIDLIKKWIS